MCYNVFCYFIVNGNAGYDIKVVDIMISDSLRNRTLCFSGHRPEKLPCKGDSFAESTRMLKSFLYSSILESIDNGYTRFITGLAKGVDLWAGEILVELKKTGHNISIISAAPYEHHGESFRGQDRAVLNSILENSDDVVYISSQYTKDCMRKRNYYMIDQSSKLIAVVSDYKSGTGQTISYAKKQGLDIKIFEMKNIFDFDPDQTTLLL